MTAIVWIRRSLREHDNTALVEASRQHDQVIPFYVVDDEYFEKTELGYPRVKFWRESLKQLKDSLKNDGKDIVVRKGKPIEQLEKIIEETGAEELYFNRDYTPYARDRDEKVRELDVEVKSFKDIVVFEQEEILTNSGTPYKVYTYYAKKWFKKEKLRPQKVDEYDVPDTDSDEIPEVEELGYEKPEGMEWSWDPGRAAGKEKLEDFKDRIWNYGEKRDLAAVDGTSKLSPHLKFGTVSIREAYWMAERIKARNPNSDTSGIKTWQEELAWRDFYMQMLYNFPETEEEAMQEQFRSIEWRKEDEAEEDWERWKNGRTGFPFVDAGMRQLKKTGWMHNRLRMVVTSFACKDLWLDWRQVHDFFSENFIDAEPASMIGGIQWAYSIGTDAQPYFRVFNPWTQGEKFDPDGEYIRRWVPELQDVPDQYIHEPHKMPENVQHDADCIIGEDYPEPAVDHDEKRKEAVEKFEQHKED